MLDVLLTCFARGSNVCWSSCLCSCVWTLPICSEFVYLWQLRLVMKRRTTELTETYKRWVEPETHEHLPLSHPAFLLVCHSFFFFLSCLKLCHCLFLTSFPFPRLSLLFVQMCLFLFYVLIFFLFCFSFTCHILRFSLFSPSQSDVILTMLPPASLCSEMWNLVVCCFLKQTL